MGRIHKVEGEKQLSQASTDFCIHTTVCTQHTHLHTCVCTQFNRSFLCQLYELTCLLLVWVLAEWKKTLSSGSPHHTSSTLCIDLPSTPHAHLCVPSAFVFQTSPFPVTSCLAAWHCLIFLSSVVSPQLQSGTELIVSVLEVSKRGHAIDAPGVIFF